MINRQRLSVALGERSYTIHFTDHFGLLDEQLGEIVTHPLNAAVILDPALRDSAFYPLLVQRFGERVYIPTGQGEELKEIGQLAKIYDQLAQWRIDRQGVVIAVGGGVIGDLAGYAAASYLRGIRCIQVPTTLLSMVDSSVGGKTGINIAAGKNLVGAFHQPEAVFICSEFLSTLPFRERAAGWAEVVKYGLLADSDLFATVEEAGKLTTIPANLNEWIHRCCAIKAAIVRDDEKETAAEGGRALLNLGHTFAHAIENVEGYGVYLHGEAVAIGLMLALRLSRELGKLADADAEERLRAVLERQELPTRLRRPLQSDALMQAMLRDKKVRNGLLRFVIIDQIGRAQTVEGVTAACVQTIWQSAGAD